MLGCFMKNTMRMFFIMVKMSGSGADSTRWGVGEPPLHITKSGSACAAFGRSGETGESRVESGSGARNHRRKLSRRHEDVAGSATANVIRRPSGGGIWLSVADVMGRKGVGHRHAIG